MKKIKYYTTIIFVVFCFSKIYSQKEALLVLRLPEIKRDSLHCVNLQNLRKGIFQNWQELLQGQTSGVLVATTDGNPNNIWQTRLLGLHSFTPNPLILVDGVPLETTDPFGSWEQYALDPQNIESIELQRDAGALAAWGQRAYSGIISIKTKTRQQKINQPSIQFSSTIGFSQVTNKAPILGATEYLRQPNALNLGTQTDWQRAVLQQTIENQHNLHYKNNIFKNTTLQTSLQARQGNGVIKNTDYTQLGGNVGLSYKTSNNRLHIDAHLSAQRRKAAVGFAEAYRYALTFNPTAPVYDSNGQFNELSLFDVFNPLSILTNAIKDRTITALNTTLKANFRVNSWLDIIGFYNLQQQDIFEGEAYQPNARFRGAATNGKVVNTNAKGQSNYINLTLEAKKTIKHWHLWAQLGTDNKNAFFNRSSETYTNFSTPSINYNNVAASFLTTVMNNNYQNTFNAIFANLKIKNNFKNSFLHISVRNQQNKTNFGIEGGLNIWQNIILQGGYGKLHSFKTREFTTFDNRYFYTQESRDLWHIDLTRAWFSNRMRAHLGFEQSNAKIMTFENSVKNSTIGINNQLFMLDVNFHLVKENNYDWYSNFFYTYLTNKVKSVENITNIRYQNIGAPGNGNLFYHEWQAGQPVGGLWANEYELVNGTFRAKDLNNNNNTEDDTRLRGQGIPRSWVSWVNKIRFYDFEIDCILRGVFGQSKVNEYRVFYENNTFNTAINAYRSSLYDANNPYIYNVLHVEKADFIRLDNLSLSYNFQFKKLGGKIFVGGQNLWTFSKYTGLDPETRLSDIGANNNGNEILPDYNNYFSAGIDRRNLYPSARNWFIGFALQL